jgi:DUF1365 family protein
VEHSFSYPVWMALLDLDEVENDESLELSSRWCSFSTQKFAVTQWRRKDHFGSNEKLSVDVKDLVRSRLGLENVGRIELLTNLSFLGLYNFNPVSIYYCYANDDSSQTGLCAIILEVSNTPWLDKRIYALKYSNIAVDDMVSWEKDFHVSPFMDGEHVYHWNVPPMNKDGKIIVNAVSTRTKKAIDSKLVDYPGAHMNGDGPCKLNENGSSERALLPKTFVVKLQLERVARERAYRVILGNPIMPLAAVLWIHVEAFWVFWKGVTYVDPPAGSRNLGLKDAAKHLIIFFIAALVRYGVIQPVETLRMLMRGFSRFLKGH